MFEPRPRIPADPVVNAAAMRVMKLLVGNPPQTVADLIHATGVTRTAVTEQLNELVAAGFVERGTERVSGRGRPRHLYRATDASLLLLFASNQRLVVPVIWRAIREIGGSGLIEDVLGRVSRSLAEYYRPKVRGKTPEKRLRELVDLLCKEGALIEVVEENGHVVMRKRSCPFISMLDEERSVCCMDLLMMSEVVGCPVRRTACRHEGAPCCTFEIVHDE